MTLPTPGHAIVAPYRELYEITQETSHGAMLDDIDAAIDTVLAKRDEAITSSIAALRIANERAAVAEALAAERLAAVLAAADFAARMANELRFERRGEGE